MKRHISLYLWSIFLTLIFVDAFCLYAAEPPSEPILRIENGMHTSVIGQIGSDSANRYLVTAADKTVRVWDTSTGELLQTLRPSQGEGWEGSMFAVSISPDGNTVAAGGWTQFNHGMSSPASDGFNIYLFDRLTGSLKKRISGLSRQITKLVFSKDGRYLVACHKGISLYRTSDYSIIGENKDYGKNSEIAGADFDQHGRLVTTSNDGYIRLYKAGAKSLSLIAKEKGRGGTHPYTVSFSPSSSSDGTKAVVGYWDTTKVDVFSGVDLEYLSSPDSTGLYNGHLAAVTWSSDGRYIYARGWAKNRYGQMVIRKWDNEGKGKYKDILIGWENTIFNIISLKNGGIAFGSTEPSFGIINAADELTLFKQSYNSDFWGNHRSFLVSHDGSTIQFYYERSGKSPATFSVKERLLNTGNASSPTDKTLLAPITSFSGLNITDWENRNSPKLNRRVLTEDGEMSRCIAISTSGESFLLGTHRFFRLFDREGRELWKVSVPGETSAVNISGDNKVAVAAFRDGTIRWYRMTDGKELIAFFPHKDRKRWVMWTPEGFFDASEGGASLIGYHLNRGKDREAEFIGIDKIYNVFYRPDLVQAKLDGKDISEYAKAIDINKLLAQNTLPPKVRFITQTGKAGNHDTTIKAEICDNGGGIGDVVMYLNDIPFTISEKGRGIKIASKGSDKCSSIEHPITLQNGSNRISLMAYNQNNNIESDKENVELTYKSATVEKPDLHILVMAVNKYRDGDLRLKYPINDAEKLVTTMQNKSKKLFNKVYIHKLFDEEVNKASIDRKFQEIGKKTKREDVFVLFIAGHGITNEKDGGYYYLPVDFRYTGDEAITKQGIAMDDFRRYLSNIQAMKSLLLLDTCNSGSFAEAIASRGIIEKTAINKLIRAVGRATIVASSKSQVALEGYEGHGVFTYTLLEGLNGKASDSESKITINNMATYIENELPKKTFKKWGYEQIPQKTLQGMDFVIGVK